MQATLHYAKSILKNIKVIRNVARMVFKRPVISKDNIKKVPFKELTRSAILSQLAYKSPNELETILSISNECKYPKKYIEFIHEFNMNQPIYYDGNPHEDAQAYMWLIPKQRLVYICFRGTQSISDIKSDIDIRCKPMIINGTDLRVHCGFYAQLNSIKKQILADLSNHISDIDKIVITGHSLGAAIATIAAAEVHQAYSNKQIHCHTFGCPRVGDFKFATWYDSNIKHNWRVFNEEDPVPLIPLSFRFQHVKNGLCMDDDFIPRECKEDYPWYLRPFASIGVLDFQDLIRDHNCVQYIERLLKNIPEEV
jgi:hypothetical protein